MSGLLHLAVGAAMLCLGVACGTVRTQPPTDQAARPLTSVLPLTPCRWFATAVRGEQQFETAPSSPPAARRLQIAGTGSGAEGEEARAVRAGDLNSPSLPATEQPNGDSKSPARVFQKWNPIWWFGNVDDPEPPDWYRPGSPSRRWLWQLRNPLHNFTFYVIGIADKPFTRTGKFPDAVFAPDGGWNWAVAKHKWVRLPFVSFNGERWRFYLGWRERGNFGGKVNFGKLPAPDPKPQTPDPATK